jgi:preflagellin peptidase FlaK
MEDIEEGEDGRLVRRFIGFTESLRRIIRGERRIYTKDLRQHPDEYQKELTLYRKAGRVWISYGIPFIIPITAGFLTALFVGDIFFVIMKAIAGM